MMEFLYLIVGWIMRLCYSISLNNYILTLLIFALVMQIVLFPFGIKRQKSSVKLATMRPKEMAIRNKYKGRNDRVTQQKMNMEIQELYKAENYSPTAGCLPLLIQMPIIFAVFGVARMPLSYTTDVFNQGVGDKKYGENDFYVAAWEIADNQQNAYQAKLDSLTDNKEAKEIEKKIKDLKTIKKEITDDSPVTFSELQLLKFMQNGVDTFMKDFQYSNGKYVIPVSTAGEAEIGKNLTDKTATGSYAKKLFYKENKVGTVENSKMYDFNSMLRDKDIYPENSKEANGAHCLPNFKFIGNTTTLDQPSFTFNWLLLIPLLVFVTSFLSSEVSRRLTTQPTADPNQPNPANSGLMRWLMPAMSTWFSLSFPAAVGLYWTFRNITSIGEQFILVKMYPAPKFTEEEMKKAVSEVKQAKKRKKLVTIEVDEDDTSYDDLAISEEKAEKIRRRRERMQQEAQAEKEARSSKGEKDDSAPLVDRPTLKDDSDRKE